MAFKIDIPQSSGRASKVNLVNLGFRFAQFCIGVIVLGIYAAQLGYGPWRVFDLYGKFSLGIAAGAIAMVTAPILAALPFFFGYRIVAFALLWDFIVMVVYAATFAYFKPRLSVDKAPDVVRDQLNHFGVDKSRTKIVQDVVWIDLVGMLLWLSTFLMAVALLIFSRVRGSKFEL